jgi:hypothetical protein
MRVLVDVADSPGARESEFPLFLSWDSLTVSPNEFEKRDETQLFFYV